MLKREEGKSLKQREVWQKRPKRQPKKQQRPKRQKKEKAVEKAEEAEKETATGKAEEIEVDEERRDQEERRRLQTDFDIYTQSLWPVITTDVPEEPTEDSRRLTKSRP